MKILITGASGFIGRNAIEELSTRNFQILAIGNTNRSFQHRYKNTRWIFGEIGKIELIKDAIINFDPDIVIHLAWEGIPDYSEKISQKNLIDSITFFDLIFEKTNCKKIIATGSCWEYGKTVGECIESDAAKVSSFFSWAKHSLYEYLLLRCKQNSIIFYWFRVFYVYGKGQRPASLIPSIIHSIKDGKLPNIKSPNAKNDFVFIGDVIELFYTAIIKNASSGIFNVGSGKVKSVLEIYKTIEIKIKGDSNVTLNSFDNIVAGDVIDFWANTEKTFKEFNWVAHTSFESLSIDELK